MYRNTNTWAFYSLCKVLTGLFTYEQSKQTERIFWKQFPDNILPKSRELQAIQNVFKILLGIWSQEICYFNWWIARNFPASFKKINIRGSRYETQGASVPFPWHLQSLVDQIRCTWPLNFRSLIHRYTIFLIVIVRMVKHVHNFLSNRKKKVGRSVLVHFQRAAVF